MVMMTFKKITRAAILMAGLMMVSCSEGEDLTTMGINDNSSTNNGTDTSAVDAVVIEDNADDFIENTTFSDTIEVVFTNGSANVKGEADDVTVTLDGGDIIVNSTTNNFIMYVLSGTTNNGMFKLYSDRKWGITLKDVDITMEDGATSRKVRRIVEKRMCQAYHRQHKNCGQNGGRDRHYMKRATSFQLHNLGQIECETGVCRTESTHWKRSYDPITGEVVFKKKMGYSTYEEAMEAARQFSLRHPEDKRTISAYKCAYCGMWHIGHYTPDEEKTYPDMVTFLGQAS